MRKLNVTSIAHSFNLHIYHKRFNQTVWMMLQLLKLPGSLHFWCILCVRGPDESPLHPYENSDFPWQPEITQQPLPVVNRLLLQSVSSQGLSLLENVKTVTSVTLLMNQSHIFHHTCQSSLHYVGTPVCVCAEVAKGHHVEVYENVLKGRQNGL